MIRFYSYPPLGVQWPYVLRNLKQKPRQCLHEIVDIGIYDLMEEPHQYTNKRLKTWQNLKIKGWKTVPDCPDLRGEFGIDVDFDPLEYSWDLLTQFYDPSDPSHLPVVQGKYQDVHSYKKYCSKFIREYKRPKKIAVGTVCKSDNILITEEIAKLTRKFFPKTWIHFFGLKLHHLRRVWMYINSYDSCSWTWPRNNGSGSGRRPQATTKKQEIQYFYEYIEQISRYHDPGQTFLSTHSPPEKSTPE